MNAEVFQPVRGTEASILASTPVNGYVYFAIDTKKIYYSNGESFLPMGGNTGVWYGKMEYLETPEEGQIEFNFNIDEIEGNEDVEDGKYNVPNLDDLIFNLPDGCFYRIVDIDIENNTPVLHCQKLTVAGGGGSGGISNTGTMTVSRIGDQTINTLQGNSCYIRYKFTATDASGESTGLGQASLYVGGILKSTFSAQQGENEIDVGPFLEIGNNSIRLVISGSVGGTSNITQSKNWTVISTNLALTWNYRETTINREDNFTFNWRVSISLPHTIHISIDNIYNIDIPSEDNIKEKSYTISRVENGLTHGSHLVSMYATTEIGGKVFTSEAITHSVICVDSEISDTIISIPKLPNSLDQYDTLLIPIIFYDPMSLNNKVSATLREDGVDIDNWIDYENGVQYIWNYTPTISGSKILSILSGTTEKEIPLMVNDLGLSAMEVPGYEFKFKASDITSNNSLQNWSFDSIRPSFSPDFDWINGGLKTELDEHGNLRNYIGIKAGNTMTFNYQPLASVSKENGFTMKFIFKANECRNYDADVINIKNDNSNVYLKLKANEGIFKSNNATIKVPYCEDSYIEFEIDIWPQSSEPYLMTWLNGVPASATTYNNDDLFMQLPGCDIVVGSMDCDVSLYMIKIYQKHLTNEQHLTNFIMDASNSSEIINRYNRNNILDDAGEISYSKLIEKNPDCDVYLYEIPYMTTSKENKVGGCSYRRYKGKTSPLQTAENVKMAVQGTSSAAYGLAAYNFNSTFTEGFTDYSKNPEGEHIDKWAMDENAIPINDYNTKVNVASCEGVNNALNQEWYERLVNHVYVTEYKKKNPKSRHTMQFMNMGVVFIKDHNPKKDDSNGVNNNLFREIDGYINDPYYKMYSVCNMGNIKRNKGVFTDLSNPYDVIMENPDNQSVYQQMTGKVKPNPETGELELYGQWQGSKFYPYIDSGEYFKTEDSIAQEGKTYYEQNIINGQPTYSQVATSVGDNVIGYFEQATSQMPAQTEVFEWRTTPDDAWQAIKESRGVDMEAEANKAWTDLVTWFVINNPNAATDAPLPEAVTFSPYTFRGYTSRADRVDIEGNVMPVYTQGNSSILAGLTISTYAGTYTHDTKEYRMAKMLNECEDHLIMDEIVFHYLFIERHALIDNVAKNTFWHTEDLQHWSMIKDYDNDTSDGNDNSGHLTLTYGYEVLDHVDHDENKSFVFNASSSVWLHFIDALLPARVRMYQALDTADIAAWDADPYLEIFETWQSRVPERIWIEDYDRKYLRPKREYQATQFLPMLEGGKKTFQRKQFEKYQEAYMSSEYFGRKCKTSMIDIRANGTNIFNMRFPITMYADCYIRVAAGSGQDPNVRQRYFRGQTLNIQLPVTGDANDMTTYFYLADYITSLKNIEQLKPKKVDISAAYRIREFSMKSTTENIFYVLTKDLVANPSKTYYIRQYNLVETPNIDDLTIYYNLVNGEYKNTTDTDIIQDKNYYIFSGYEAVEYEDIDNISNCYEKINSNQNLNLDEISFRANRMLERLEVTDCPSINNSLDLTSSTHLNYLDIRRSGFTGITLASNAPVETLLLNNPNVLSFSNLFKVQNFDMGYENINGLNLNNIDNTVALNSKDLVQESENTLRIYNLQNVQWVLTDPNEISDTNISILDLLLRNDDYIARQPYNFIQGLLINKADALSGTLTITSQAYSGNNSLNLYKKYTVNPDYNFPNLDLIFEDANAKLHNIYITDGNNNIIWKNKSLSGTLNINSEFLETGPMGNFNIESAVNKMNTAANTFDFDNKWQVINTSTNEIITTINHREPFAEIDLNTDITIKPVFIEQIRQYQVIFKTEDEILLQGQYDYGTKVNTLIPKILPTKDESDLDIYETYAFLGYSLTPTAKKPLIFTDDVVVNNNITYYAIYTDVIDVSDSRNVPPLDMFNFAPIMFEDPETNYSYEGYTLSPKVNVELRGKITIPTYYQGEIVHTISGFGNGANSNYQPQTSLQGVFFEADTKIKSFSTYCFYDLNTSLKYVEIPDSLRHIGSHALRNTRLKFIPRGMPKTSKVYYFGNEKTSNLYKIESYGAVNCIDDWCTQITFPGNLKVVNKDPVNKICSIGYFNTATNLIKIIFGSENSPSRIPSSDNNEGTWHALYLNSSQFSNKVCYIDAYITNDDYQNKFETCQDIFNACSTWSTTNYAISLYPAQG